MMDKLADGSICFFDRISKVFDKNINSITELNDHVHPRTSIELTIDRSNALTWDMKYFVTKGMCNAHIHTLAISLKASYTNQGNY